MPGTYAQVQAILEAAATDGQPGHDGQGRFWTKTLADFMGLEVYEVAVIAAPGPDRGARSGLILALRGQTPFDGSDFDQMPENRPPVAAADIDYIQQWIDDGCPE